MSNHPALEEHRSFWAGIAKKHGWYVEPFCVVLWVDPDTNEVLDSVSHLELKEDVIIYQTAAERE